MKFHQRSVIVGALVVACVGAGLVSAQQSPATAAAPPFTSNTTLSNNIPRDTIAIVGDFDNDLIDDVLWYGYGGIIDRYWKGKAGGSFTGSAIAIRGRYEPLTGDFDGDGNLDIFWYTAGTGADYIWWGSGDAGSTTVPLSDWFDAAPMAVNGSYRPLLADFDGDNKSDILWYAPGGVPDAFWYGRNRSGFTSRATAINGDYDYVTGGDFQGTGDLDLIWWRVNVTRHAVWNYNGGSTRTYSNSVVDSPGIGAIPMVMKINSDAQDDLLWYGEGGIPDAVAYGPSFARISTQISGRYAPLWGNFDGDNNGYDDVLWWGYLPAGGDSFWRGTGSSSFASVSMVGLTHYDFDTHAPLLGYFGSDEPLDVIFHDSQPGGTSAFFYGEDVDGASLSVARRETVRGRSCGPRPVRSLLQQCTSLQR